MSILPTNEHFQLQHRVADRLRTAILEGQYKPGAWLRQERLAQELGVSQIPVREALKALEAGDPDRAEACMQLHIRNAKLLLISSIREEG
jgi:DNA-binding GntR family transcriptional regulator